MKKIFIILFLAYWTNNLFAQNVPYNDIVYLDGDTKGGTDINCWHKTNLYYYFKNYNCNLTSSQCQTAIQSAFNTWSQYSNFTFTQTYDLSLADISLSWEPVNHSGCVPFNYGELAHSTKGPLVNQTPPCFIHFNENEHFTMTSSYYNLEAVALHEIGHVLGLFHDTIHTSAVMYLNYGYKLDLTNYDLSALYDMYEFQYPIIGPQLVYTSGAFYVDNLPSCFNVSWSLSDNYYNQNCLQQNYPLQNQCTITRSTIQDMMDATLTAAIMYNGDTIKTLTKTGMYAYADFKGQYTSGNISGIINYMHYFVVKPTCSTFITSPNLIGGTASYSSSFTIPSYWGYSYDTGLIHMIMPADNNGMPIVINVDDICGNHYQLYAVPQSSKDLNIFSGDDNVTIMISENVESSMDLNLNQPWTLEIYNGSSGEQKTVRYSQERTVTVSTSGWPRGMYVVKVTIGNKIFTEKMFVK